MHESLAELSGVRLPLDEYFADFQQRFWTSRVPVSWKFERQQVFAEPGNQSWRAFNNGDWNHALEILRERRPEVADYENRLKERGMEVRRARVVEQPISGYLMWELNSLKIRQEYGGRIRVVQPDAIADLEKDEILPEVFIIGDEAAYRVLYDTDGTANGAILSTDKPVIESWLRFVGRVYESGEELSTFFDREITGRRPCHAA